MELAFEGLKKSFKKRMVVSGTDIKLKNNEIVGLLGPNGAGKTTTFKMVIGLLKPDAGSIYLDSNDISKLPVYKRALLGIGYLPQETSVFRNLTVEENLKAILQVRKIKKQEISKRVDWALNEFGLTKLKNNNAWSLSGGERRRTEIARALVTYPSFMLLDEPFTGVDPISVSEIQDMIISLKKRNIGILITDHSVREMLTICDRAYIMFDGKIIKHGNPEEIISSENVRNVYLGDKFKI